MKKISLGLPEKMLKEIDEKRGLVSRTAWIRNAIELHLKELLR